MSLAPAPCAVFDLDGTLVDSAPTCAAILNAMLEAKGATARVTLEETRPHVTAGGSAMVTTLLGPACCDAALDLAEFRRRYASISTPPSSLYPDAYACLQTLRDAGIVLAVWSNKPQPLCEKVLGDLNLGGLFRAVVGTAPGVPLKPDPVGLDLALSMCGAARETCVFVGDSELDHEAARIAGVPLIMLTHGYGDYGRDWEGATLAGGLAVVARLVCDRLGR